MQPGGNFVAVCTVYYDEGKFVTKFLDICNMTTIWVIPNMSNGFGSNGNL